MPPGQEKASFRVGSATELAVASNAVADFYARHWQRRIALAIPSFYRWQFVAAPESGGLDHCCLAVDNQGRILGVMGLNPRRFILGGTPEASAELTTWVVAEEARGLGVGRAILAWLMSRYDVLLGPGITAAALPLYRAAGFRHIAAVPRFVRIYRPDIPEAFARLTDFGRRQLDEFLSEPRPRAVEAHSIDVADMARLAAQRLSSTNHYLRDAAHLDWRYRQHPVFKYDLYEVAAGRERAVVVLRRERVAEVDFVHVVECFGDADAIPGAVSFIDRISTQEGRHFADFTCTASSVSRFFRAAGWHSIADDKDVQVINLFYPPEHRDPPTTSLVLWARSRMSELLDLGRLYVTKGDLDLDRPTHAYYEQHGLLTTA